MNTTNCKIATNQMDDTVIDFQLALTILCNNQISLKLHYVLSIRHRTTLGASITKRSGGGGAAAVVVGKSFP